MRHFCWVFLLLSLLASDARADHGPPTWTFTGTVTSVNDPGGFLSVSVDDPASGRIVWSTSMNQIFSVATVAYYQELAGSVLGVSLDVGGVDYSPNASANVTLQIHDDNTTFDDRFFLSDAAVTNTGGLTYAASGLNVSLLDEDRAIFSSTDIPATLPPLSAYESATASLTFTNINGTGDSANVTIDLLTLEEEAHPPPGIPAVSPGGLIALSMLLALAGAHTFGRAGRWSNKRSIRPE